MMLMMPGTMNASRQVKRSIIKPTNGARGRQHRQIRR